VKGIVLMTTVSVEKPHAALLPVRRFFQDIYKGSPGLVIWAGVFLVGFALCSAMPLVDDRLLLGVSVWEKPAKFFFSLAVHLTTVAWALSLLEGDVRRSRGLRLAVSLMTAAAALELIYIVGRAARGEASHFNTATPFDAALYSIMGVGALTLTFTAAYVGYRVWRNRAGDIWCEAAGLGLMLGAVLGTLTAGYLSSRTGHSVGGAVGDASGLPFFHWSTTGGDLRVAHFVGLHAMQMVPLAAHSGRRGIVYGLAVLVIVLTWLTFWQALMGMPLFRV
jgi:hypothetical protein